MCNRPRSNAHETNGSQLVTSVLRFQTKFQSTKVPDGNQTEYYYWWLDPKSKLSEQKLQLVP